MSGGPILTPTLKRLPPDRGTTLTALDLGTNKVVCLIAELTPEAKNALKGHEGERTHKVRVIGVGHHRSTGVKAGAVVDLVAAEAAIRHAVHAAERMARVEVQSVLVGLTGGRLGSLQHEGAVQVGERPVTGGDVEQAIGAAGAACLRPGRALLHALPVSFKLDGASGVKDPSGMVGSKLGCRLHVVSGDASAARGLMLAVERCHLDVEAVVATPYASALACLVEDEAETGALVIDMGAGTTSLAVFEGGRLVHLDAVAVGGHHVTMDVARGLRVRVAEAERLKTLHGSTIATASCERDFVAVSGAEEEAGAQVSKSQLVRIIRPRVEEILELVRDRLRAAGHPAERGHRVVLTGGASQLPGLPDVARAILGATTRAGRPAGIEGLPEAARGPAFAAASGLLVYPQLAGLDRSDAARGARRASDAGEGGYLKRVTRWLANGF